MWKSIHFLLLTYIMGIELQIYLNFWFYAYANKLGMYLAIVVPSLVPRPFFL